MLFFTRLILKNKTALQQLLCQQQVIPILRRAKVAPLAKHDVPERYVIIDQNSAGQS